MQLLALAEGVHTENLSFHICKTGWIIPMYWDCENSMRERLQEHFFKAFKPSDVQCLFGEDFPVCVDSFKWNVSNINLKCSVVFLYCVKCIWKRHMATVDSMTGLTQDLCERNWVCWDVSQGSSMEDQPLMAVPKGWGKKFFSPEEESERGVTTLLSA